MGFIAGRSGVVVIFVLTEVFIAIHALILLFVNRDALREPRPMLPYAFAATVVYFVFLRDAVEMFMLNIEA